MFKVIAFIIAMSLFSPPTHADVQTEKYSSSARNKSGEVAYLEHHEVTFDGQHVQKANTRYMDPKGQVIGEMSSDFTKMVTTPAYEYRDLRTNTSHGIKLEGDKITLWRKNKAGKVEESDFFKSNFASDTLIVGCQGLHYYLIDNLELVRQKKTISIAYFMPGKLDYYKFTLRLDREDDKFIYLKLSIDSFFLRLFTSSLDLKYSKSDRRLVQFAGLSNITNDKDQIQSVVIDYKYE